MRLTLPHNRQVGAALLSALWLIVPLMPVLHGDHSHRYCPEHQTFEEGNALESEHSELPADGDAAVRAANASADSGEHLECPIFNGGVRSTLAKRTASGVLVDLPAATAAAPDVRVDTPQLSVLTVAPKSSPPV